MVPEHVARAGLLHPSRRPHPQILEVFPAQAAPAVQNDLEPEDQVMNDVPYLLLVDSKGVGLLLFPGADNTLFDPLNKRIRNVPDRLRLSLNARGLIFK